MIGKSKASNAPAPDPIDVHVGVLLRRVRKSRGVSQSDLGQALGLTFQQVQKYERGTNRISASKLFKAAKFLGVPVESFFEGLESTSNEGDDFSLDRRTTAALTDPQIRQLVQYAADLTPTQLNTIVAVAAELCKNR